MAIDVSDRIYEAAFTAELWPAALDAMADMSDSVGAVMFCGVGNSAPPSFVASASIRSAVEAYCASDTWVDNERPAQWCRFDGVFVRGVDLFDPAELDSDRVGRFMAKHGLGWSSGTAIPLPTGQAIVLSLDRRVEEGPHERTAIEALNTLSADLARAGLIAARLGIDRAASTVRAMDAIGLPAAVLAANGRVLAANGLMEQLPAVFISRARDRLSLADGPANEQLRAAVAQIGDRRGAKGRTVALSASADRPAMIIHVIPLRRSAHDIFGGGDVLIVAAVANSASPTASPALLTGLFDLTSAESRLAAALAAGRRLKQAATDQSIAFSTARSYLESVFRKTGVNSQAQLVALIKAMPQLAPAA